MPYNEKTGKSYPYTKEGIEQYEKDKVGGMPMKNMKYWQEKGTLPGVNPEACGHNLDDGRSPSSALQFNPLINVSRAMPELTEKISEKVSSVTDAASKGAKAAFKGVKKFVKKKYSNPKSDIEA